jgi:hypothetical protein
MRDDRRIKKLCSTLEKAWSMSPDERLGQFLSNWVYGHHVDIWFMGDDLIIDALLDFIKTHKGDSKK